ncbi:MAG: patatin-like phospholipase family protein [Candidatus Margulisiibacteriota bacterium]
MFDWLFPKKKVGLVLGGGVARGIAHIGVLKVLLENQVPIACVVGTSSGSLVAAAFAAGLNIEQIEQIALRIRWNEFFKFTFFRPGFLAGEVLEDLVTKYMGDLKIADLKLPYAAVATDLRTGKRVVIDSGRLAKAVAASSTFPGFFAPEELRGQPLIDGGIAGNVPVDVAREMGAEYIIASDVVPAHSVKSIPADPLQVLGRSLDLMLKSLSREEAHRAEVLIELEMEEDIWHLDFHKAQKLITAGEVAAHRAINKIKKDLRLKSVS